MGMSTLCLCRLFVALLAAVAGVESCLFGQTDVGRRCPATLCPTNKICRVVQSSSGMLCSAQASCLTCVPPGIDDLCNSNNYYYTVLTGDPRDVRSLTKLKCNLNGTVGPQCPRGSVCLPEGEGSGSCCYGKGYPPYGQDGVYNNDTVCLDRCGGCGPDYTCKQVVLTCLIPPCPVEYRCVERERKCPPPIFTIPEICFNVPRLSECSANWQCQGKKLCCPTICTNERCLDSIPV